MATVVELLRQHAEQRAADRAFVFLDGGETTVSYAELDAAARRVAAAVSARGATGEPVLLLYPPGRAYVEGFLGCLYAGAIAVPAYPPDPARLARTLPRLRALAADCGAKLALSVSALVDAVPALAAEAPELGALDWIATDAVPSDESWTPPGLDADSLALLQYTSGSTGAPKGVLLNHANLLHNAELVHTAFGTSPESVGMSWLPPYHDMGLIGGILGSIYVGLPTVLMSPLEFLQRPMAWLETISRYGVTISGGPNFAFDLCVRKSTPEQRAALDLSTWAVAFCGAEPVRAATLDRFAEAFAGAGFRREAFYPCYGLAEATLIVTGGRRDEPPRLIEHGDAAHVGCGTALGDQKVVVVDTSAGTPCPPGVVGEIWVSGPSVAQGYWNRPAETAQTFGARLAGDRYLRTGDLGFLDPGGELVVTGRAKDLIIIRGRNVYPQDLEHAVEQQVTGVRPGCSAAFAVEVDGEERVAFACEVSSAPDSAATIAAIRQVLAEAAEVSPAAVVLLRPRTVPKTSSGKIQRHACRAAFTNGTWNPDVVAREEWGVFKYHHYGEDGPLTTTITDLVRHIATAFHVDPSQISPDAPLTTLGLDSLGAVELRHTLDAALGLDVPVSELLGGITVAELGERATPAPEWPRATADPAQTHNGVSDGQRALWFVQRMDPRSTAYHISRAARIHSALDVPALDRALRALVRRHPALRTCFPSDRGEPVARVFEWDGPVLDRHDAAGLDEAILRRRLQEDAARPFDLESGPLFRVSLYTKRPEEHVLLLSVHHIVADFWSLSVLVDDLLTLYGGGPADQGEQPHQTTADNDRRMAYWRRALAGAPPALDLPTTGPRPRLQSFRGAAHDIRIEPPTVAGLDALARQAGTTRFVALLAGFAALLSRYVGDDVVIGTPTAGRDDRRSAGALGYLVNPVPLRVRVPPGISFRELVARARTTVIHALDNAVPFAKLVEALRPVRDPGRSPVMQAMLTLQQSPPGRPDLAAFAVSDESVRIRLGGLDVQPVRLDTDSAAFDVSIMLAEVAGGLSGSIEYCTDLFDAKTMARLDRQFRTVLANAVAEPDASVDSLELMDGAERAAVLALADGGDTPPPEPATLHALFAAQAARRPDATAVVHGGDRLTYGELDARADRLAAVLRDRFGVGRGGVVGVHLPRTPDWIVAFWASLKAGGVYLPLEPALPAARLAWMIADARPLVLLTHSAIADRLPADGPPRIRLDDDLPVHTPAAAPTNAGPDDLAYILYTSGSTGRPKGVLVPHRGASNVCRSEAVALKLTEDDRLLQYSACSYDVSVDEIIVAHLHGAELHLPPPEAAIPGPELVRMLTRDRITAAAFTPSVLAAVPDAPLPDLARMQLGGETCSAELVTRWAPGRRFINSYGPTEATICVTLTFDPCEPDGIRPPIGRPIPNVRTYVLDARMRPVPVGVPGELYVGGVCLAWGYLGRPDLTAERFVPDPYGATPGGRLYRTGDLVRWLADGSLDFLDRLDDQVKIRGVRIEPGEAESVLRELLGVREVAVVPRPGPAGEAELVAYLVVPEQHRPPVAELRGRLRAELPEPLVPAAFVYLDAMPLTPSDKIDRRALPAPAPADRGGRTARLAPRTDLERTVAEVWATVLGVPEVGVRDHFFDELGGSSLLVSRVVSELGDRLGRDVPVTHLFEHPTVEALAGRLQRGEPHAGPGAQPEDHAAARRQALARRRRSGG